VTQQTDRLNVALAGRYTIERELGTGGMATVYLAADLKHDRKVALKVLKPELAAVLGAERFVVEIKTTAALQHPHILPLFDSGAADGFLFYVMPFIDGETLRAKLDRETQLAIDEAVRIAGEVLDALQYAHEHGIVHRDVKPENILLHGGHAMVADFGIALAVSAAAGGRMTETGLSLGTPHYMSPEQATAEKDISARSDVYSLGSVLYEMLTGQPPHLGGSAQQIIMKIITEPAEPVTKHRKSVPPNVAAAVAKSLEKLPADRFESAKAFADALHNSSYTIAGSARGATGARALGGRRATYVSWALTVLALIAAAFGWLRPEPPVAVAARLIAELPDSVQIPIARAPRIAISRDGRRLAVVGTKVGNDAVYVRNLDDPTLAPVRGSDHAAQISLSPDGEWLAFVLGGRRVMKLPIIGGTPQLVADSGRSPSWGEGGEIVYWSPRGVMLVSGDGAKPRLLVASDSLYRYLSTTVLPGGHDVVATRRSLRNTGEEFQLVLVSTTDGRVTDLGMAGIEPRYSGGRLVFGRQGGLVFSAPYSLRKRAITGPATLLLQDVWEDPFGVTRGLDVAVAENGTLVYRAGGAADLRIMVSVDRQGLEQPLSREDRAYGEPRVSPDGRRIVVRVGESSDIGDVWIYDIGAGSLTPLTTDKKSIRPEWSRDGVRIITVDYWQTDSSLVRSRPWDGNGSAQILTRGGKGELMNTVSLGVPHGWSAFRLGSASAPPPSGDIWIAPTDSLSARKPFVATLANELMPRVSPSGRLVAYSSNESSRTEVYVTPIPGPGPRVPVSIGGGQEPVWSSDGGSLFFRGPSRMMVATIAERPMLTVTRRDSLFVDPYDRASSHGSYDVFPDGKRFVMTRSANGTARSALFVVVNWQQLISTKQRVAGDGR
jgi:eukaryotic-like serine/threonine-protein kinase